MKKSKCFAVCSASPAPFCGRRDWCNKRLKIIAFVDGVSNSAAHLNAVFCKEFLGFFEGCIGHNQQIAVGFEVNFIDMHLRESVSQYWSAS